MNMYSLYWGVYPQWHRQYESEAYAVAAAKKFINDVGDGKVSEFKLIKQIPINIK